MKGSVLDGMKDKSDISSTAALGSSDTTPSTGAPEGLAV